jgi:cell division protein FtsN
MKSLFVLMVALAFGVAFAGDPTDMDSLFRGNEYTPELNASLREASAAQGPAVPTKNSADKKASNELYVLQFEAVGDFDAAQRRRAELSASTGYAIQVVFDAPFYKLRAGGWSSKKAADDKARELSAYNISAFVVKVR